MLCYASSSDTGQVKLIIGLIAALLGMTWSPLHMFAQNLIQKPKNDPLGTDLLSDVTLQKIKHGPLP